MVNPRTQIMAVVVILPVLLGTWEKKSDGQTPAQYVPTILRTEEGSSVLRLLRPELSVRDCLGLSGRSGERREVDCVSETVEAAGSGERSLCSAGRSSISWHSGAVGYAVEAASDNGPPSRSHSPAPPS